MVFIGYAREITPGLPSSPILKLDEFVDVVKNLHDPAFGGLSRQRSERIPAPGPLVMGAAPEDSCSEFSEEREAGLNEYKERKDVLGRGPLRATFAEVSHVPTIPEPVDFRCATISNATESRSGPCLTAAGGMA